MTRFCAEKCRPVSDFSRYIMKNCRRLSVKISAVSRVAAATRQRPTHSFAKTARALTRLASALALAQCEKCPTWPRPSGRAFITAFYTPLRVSRNLRVVTTSESAPGVALYASKRADMRHRTRIINLVWLVCVFCCVVLWRVLDDA